MLHGPLSFQGFARTPLHNYHLCKFASLALKGQMATVCRQHLPHPQAEDFRNARARVVEQQQEQIIAPARPVCACGGENRLDLGPAEETQDRSVVAFHRDGQ